MRQGPGTQDGAVYRLLALLLALAATVASPLQAQVLSVETYIEEWDPAAGQWVRVSPEDSPRAERFLSAQTKARLPAIAVYGPFRVIDPTRASMVGVTDGAAPRQFAAMLRDFPGISALEMIECPGTEDDRGNMRLGRMIRAAGITTHVPPGGSVRSGAVELFLAGADRRIDDGAEFAVHSWLDDSGREPRHFAADSPENRLYLDYYREMGMTEGEAQAFYAMTNIAVHDDAMWLTARDMRGWIGQIDEPGMALAAAPNPPNPAIAYLDLSQSFP